VSEQVVAGVLFTAMVVATFAFVLWGKWPR
jgi:hypothetical protein